jgi:hypothetical protein
MPIFSNTLMNSGRLGPDAMVEQPTMSLKYQRCRRPKPRTQGLEVPRLDETPMPQAGSAPVQLTTPNQILTSQTVDVAESMRAFLEKRMPV